MSKITPALLRRQALSASFFPPTTLGRAIGKMGFVQADPIRAPARAQDLILRHRVRDYRAGELERHYGRLRLEEDYLYAYGFMPRSTWQLLHPRIHKALTPLEERVLAIVAEHKRIHPRELESYLGRQREVNAWGGYSKVTTRALEALHYRGLLRVAGRSQGIRLYEAPKQIAEELNDPGIRETRLQKLTLLIASILAPIPQSSLRATVRHLAYAAPRLEGRLSVVNRMIESGQLATATSDDIQYLWPEACSPRRQAADRVRFLAPFDPLVWDRYRFEHLWQWRYRFEAYTPATRRKLGYYALPLLWRDAVIGWVNISNSEKGLKFEPGFAGIKPSDSTFRRAYSEEVERFREFLNV